MPGIGLEDSNLRQAEQCQHSIHQRQQRADSSSHVCEAPRLTHHRATGLKAGPGVRHVVENLPELGDRGDTLIRYCGDASHLLANEQVNHSPIGRSG